MKLTLSGLTAALIAAVLLGCGGSSKSGSTGTTSEGIAVPGALAPRTPSEVRVQEAEEHREQLEAQAQKEEEDREARQRDEEKAPPSSSK